MNKIEIALNLTEGTLIPPAVTVGVKGDRAASELVFVPDSDEFCDIPLENFYATLHTSAPSGYMREDKISLTDGQFVCEVACRESGVHRYALRLVYDGKRKGTFPGEFIVGETVDADEDEVGRADPSIIEQMQADIAKIKQFGGGGTADHDLLENRDEGTQHPASAIAFADGESFQDKLDAGELKGYTPVKGVDYDDGDKGDPFTYEDFTSAQLASLKGDAFTYADFTPEQLAALEGTDGYTPIKGTDYDDGENGVSPHIGANGNWFVGDTDTGTKAQGPAAPITIEAVTSYPATPSPNVLYIKTS